MMQHFSFKEIKGPVLPKSVSKRCPAIILAAENSHLLRVDIRPVFPGHVLLFRVQNSVRADFFNLAKCPVFFYK